jgi:hypothetical protein
VAKNADFADSLWAVVVFAVVPPAVVDDIRGARFSFLVRRLRDFAPSGGSERGLGVSLMSGKSLK